MMLYPGVGLVWGFLGDGMVPCQSSLICNTIQCQYYDMQVQPISTS